MSAASGKTLERTTFNTSRLLEFFSAKELTMQMGHEPECWPVALVKELIDNALDACETAGAPPAVRVTVGPDAVAVQDNGPGLPADVLCRSLDYTIRVSDKSHYVSPTRGQLGNALKCVWAAPFVADGEHGRVEVATRGQRHVIEVSLDRIEQRPRLQHAVLPDGTVRTGTRVRIHWPEVASYLVGEEGHDFYRIDRLLAAYATLNPHGRFELHVGRQRTVYKPSVSAWPKWLPPWPTSPHWYTIERLRGLIAAYIGKERDGAKARTIREFLAEFHGLTGTLSRKAVLADAALTGAWLHDLVSGDDVDAAAVRRLLGAMTAVARPVRPKALGIIGEPHLTASLVSHIGIDRDSIRYKRFADEADGLPFVIEVAFGVQGGECQGRREIIAGVNWSPILGSPFPQLDSLLGESRIDYFDPATVIVHLACPRPEFTDRGKGRLALPPAIGEALRKCVRLVTRQWRDAKRQADREGRLHSRQLERLRKANRPKALSIKEAAYQAMEEAYLHASGNNTYPANARQVMYAARPRVLELTGGKCWSKSSYFTQTLLPNFVEVHPDLTATWDVVYDARGHLVEPHTGRRIDLGTPGVRRYVGDWTHGCPDRLGVVALKHDCPTCGPANRYRFALFVEKEGFDPLLKRTLLAQRFDVAIMSTKGMSVTAARKLVDDLSAQGVTILVLRDFDKAGFSIVHTLRTDSRRYRFRSSPKVIDLGLRLQDVCDLGLSSEPVSYRDNKDPRERLRECGATDDERNFLVREERAGGWDGERVELNAMTSPQFIAFLEGKFAELGVRKVVPEGDALASAYRRAWRTAAAQAAIDRAVADQGEADVPDMPPDLAERITRAIEGGPQPWDEALWQIVRADWQLTEGGRTPATAPRRRGTRPAHGKQ
jgi:DNA topoisomerase VI subunit B